MLATVHRAENTDNRKNLERIVDAFIESRELIVFPAHPRTRKRLEEYGLMEKVENAENMILTDSGSVQKGAYFLKVPLLH